MIEIIQGNVLAAEADALLLTIDGAKRGVEGNISRAFARKWPDVWMEIEDEVKYPLPLGRTVAVRLENDCEFALILVASTLHHLDILGDAEKINVIQSALREAIQLALRNRVRKLALTPMTGGWRLDFRAALAAMMDVLRPIANSDSSFSVALHVLSADDAKIANEVVQRLADRTGGEEKWKTW